MTTPSAHLPTTCDILIVGSGAAGLLAAYEALRIRPGTRVVIVDAGLSLKERPEATQSQMVGFGGAGLYLGGRLYLGPATIPVTQSVSAPPGQRPILGGAAYLEHARAVDDLFAELGATATIRPAPEGALADAVSAARDAGLEYVTSYPARIIERTERLEVMRRLRERLEVAGAVFAFGLRVESVERADGGFRATLRPPLQHESPPCHVLAACVILAPGRYGAEWLVETARGLGASVEPLPTAFGVRLEFAADAYAPLTTVNPDPRLQLALPDEDAVIKTYATCPGGVVTPVCRYGALVASGVPLPPDRRRRTTTFAALLQPGYEGALGVWRGTDEITRAVNERSPRALIVQRLGDAFEGRATDASTLRRDSPIQPTCLDASPGALHDLYPPAYWSALEDLLTKIARLAPALSWGDALAYGPAEERFWRFPTDDHLQTSAPGLFVSGDGPGQSQGVIQAGVAGLLAGRGAAELLG